MNKTLKVLRDSTMWALGYKLLRAFLGVIISAIIGWLAARGWIDKSNITSGDIQKIAEWVIITGGAVWVAVSTWRRTVGQHLRAIIGAAMKPSTLQQVDQAVKDGVKVSATTPANVLPTLPEGHQ